MVKQWVAAAAIAAQTAYAPPADASVPEFVGVRNLSIGAAAAAFSATIFEAGVAYTATPAAGEVAADVLAQQLVSGDAIPAGALIVVDLVTRDEVPYNG